MKKECTENKLTNEDKELLVNAMEEASEVIKECSKCIRFGTIYDKTYEGGFYHNNAKEAIIEFHHLEAVLNTLQDKGILPKFTEGEVDEIKRDKMERYYNITVRR